MIWWVCKLATIIIIELFLPLSKLVHIQWFFLKWIPDQEANKLCIQDIKHKKFGGTYLEGLNFYLYTL